MRARFDEKPILPACQQWASQAAWPQAFHFMQ
jgi:hypothetical protein